MKSAAIFAVFAFSFGLYAAAPDPHQDMWYMCKKTSDCVVSNACGTSAVNKLLARRWAANQKCKMKSLPDKTAKAECMNGKCVLVH